MEAIYNEFLKNAMVYYYSEEDQLKCYGSVPKQRDYTFNKCIEHFKNSDFINILELGTSRSFVDGRYPGVCSTDTKFWEPKSLEKWDWSAGLFTKYFSDVLTERGKDFKITTVDINQEALNICKVITSNNKDNIEYILNSSEQVISSCQKKSIDLLYLDTGNMDETTALLHLREADALIKNDILKDDGLILIDDVKNPYMILNNLTTNKLGKSKYSIPYLLENGFELVEDEYQVILKKKQH